MKDVDDWVYSEIGNCVYKCGFATTQLAYDIAIEKLFTALDKLEDILTDGRKYLVGD